MSVFGAVTKKLLDGKQARFFSQAARSAENLQRKTGNADGFKNDLIGKGQVKPDELKAMGFEEHFGDRKDISREEVQQFIGDNQLQIKETVLGRNDDKPYGLYDDDDMLVEAFATRAESDAALDAVPQEVFDRGEYWRSGEVGGGDTSKFGSYTLDGGDNYRELLMSLPNQKSGQALRLSKKRSELRSEDQQMAIAINKIQKDQDSSVNPFLNAEEARQRLDVLSGHRSTIGREIKDIDVQIEEIGYVPDEFVNSGHFDEPNILAHLRMKDRVDTDGNKTLLIEEAQSDWHQKGADRGYVNQAEYEGLKSEQKRLNIILDDTSIEAGFNWGTINAPDLSSAVESARTAFRAARQKAEDFPLLDHSEVVSTTRDNLQAAKIELDDAFQADYLKQYGVRPGNAHEQAQSEMQMLRAELDPMHDAVPDAPFKTDDKSSWYNLAMKRGLIEAAEGGYDKMAITTGRQQAERYNLSKSINEVRLGGNEQGGFTVSAFDKDDNPVIMQSIESLDQLPTLIGKDAANSLVDQPFTDTPTGAARILAGQDLNVGGDGMKQFYDRTLPNTLNKLVKQDGVKVGQSEILGKTPFKTEIASASDRKEILRLRDEIYNGDDTSATHDRYNELLAMYQPKPRTDTVHSIDVTPEMRERVKKGLPLFAQGGAVVGAGALFSPGEAHANLMDEDKKLRAMGSKAWGKVSPELAAYRRAQILPDMATLAQGAVRDTAKGLDYLSPANLTRLLLDPANEGLSRFISPPISNMKSEAAKVVTQPMLYDEDDKYSKERKRKTMDIGGMLFSPI